MNTIQNVITAIHNMNNDELNQVVEAIKLQRTFLARQKAVTFRVGDTVNFAARGMQVVGTVTKVNTKTVAVKQNNAFTTWRVHASLLKKVDTLA
jgi:hypothetical protein